MRGCVPCRYCKPLFHPDQKKLPMKPYLLTILICYTVGTLQAQNQRGTSRSVVRLYGKVIDAKTRKGLDAVSVQLKKLGTEAPNTDSIDPVIAGMFTRPNGDFSFENISLGDSVFLVITAVGYKRLEKHMQLTPPAGTEGQSGV